VKDWYNLDFYFIRHLDLIYSILHQCLDGLEVSTLAFHAGDPGSILPLDQQIFKFPFSPSHPSGVSKPSSLKLATSGITHPSDAQRGES
jgi:hypothetical protein